jgi:hypothetical protein
MRRSVGFASVLAGWTALAAAAAPLAQTAPPLGPAPAPASPSAPISGSAPISAPGTAGEPTVVKGGAVNAAGRPPLKDLPRAVFRFVRSHGAPSPRSGWIARWGSDFPICVVTTGLDPAFNDFVTRRVQEVAASVGAPLATSKPGAPCGATVEISFANDPQAEALAAFKRNDRLMGFHYPADVPRLSKFEPPIKAWYATGSYGNWGLMALDDIYTHAFWGTKFVNVLVIADKNKVAGYEIGPISDYMAMLVLTQPRLQAFCGPLPSIVDLMSPNCSDQDKPKTLTPADLAYLEALYATSGDQNLYLERDGISDHMRRELTAAH